MVDNLIIYRNFIYFEDLIRKMVTSLSRKDYIITKIILAIGLIPFSFYMLQTDILKDSLLDSLIGIDTLQIIFSIMLFFLTIFIISLALSFTQISKSDKEVCFDIFNWTFDMGVYLSAFLFILAFFIIVSIKIGNALKIGLIDFINKNISMIIFVILIFVAIFIYNKYLKKVK